MAGLVKIEELLSTALSHAPEEDRQKLAQAIEDFAATYSRSWKHLQASPYAGLMDAIVEGSDAMPGLQQVMERT